MSKGKDAKPVFGTREWAEHNENLIIGCSHDCKYCYAKENAINKKWRTKDSWKDEVPRPKQLKHGFKKRPYNFMFPSTHDITPEHLDECMSFLSRILKPGNQVLIVSKPHLDCVKAICNELRQYRQQILFRFTIGSADNNTLQFWDVNSPGFEERMESLRYACWAGYATSISCEPMLDAHPDELIRQLRPYVTNSIWLGKGNRLISRLEKNGHGDQETIQRAEKLIEDLSDEYIRNLYSRYKADPLIKWKESLKKVIGIEIPTEAGLDI